MKVPTGDPVMVKAGAFRFVTAKLAVVNTPVAAAVTE
jgi:hypothetical protein